MQYSWIVIGVCNDHFEKLTVFVRPNDQDEFRFDSDDAKRNSDCVEDAAVSDAVFARRWKDSWLHRTSEHCKRQCLIDTSEISMR